MPASYRTQVFDAEMDERVACSAFQRSTTSSLMGLSCSRGGASCCSSSSSRRSELPDEERCCSHGSTCLSVCWERPARLDGPLISYQSGCKPSWQLYIYIHIHIVLSIIYIQYVYTYTHLPLVINQLRKRFGVHKICGHFILYNLFKSRLKIDFRFLVVTIPGNISHSPNRLGRHLEKLLYFELSPPWHLYVLLLANLLAFYLTYLLAFYLAYLLAFYLAYLLAFYLAYLLQYVLAYLLALYLACLLAYLLTFYLANILANLLAFYLANILALYLA